MVDMNSELFTWKMGGVRPEGEGCQGGYELRIIYCKKCKKVGAAGRGCLSGYELRNIYCENAKKSRRGVRVLVVGELKLL